MRTGILLLVAYLAIGILPARGQAGGNVSVHSDPRLSLLLTRTKAIEKVDEIPPLKISDKKSARSKTGKGIKAEQTEAQTPKYTYAESEGSVIAEKIKEIKKGPANTGNHIAPESPRSATLRAASSEKLPEKRATKEIAHEEHHAVKGVSGGPRYAGKGFRVQIYYGPNRQEALKRKSEFMHNYPGIPTYLTFVTPHYRVKVGDFRKRDDALGMLKEANGTYSPCMIVPDAISIGKN